MVVHRISYLLRVALLLVSCCSFISDGLLVELARALARLLLRRRGGSCRESWFQEFQFSIVQFIRKIPSPPIKIQH